MKFFVISDNSDTLTGLRLAGMEGALAKTKEDALLALETAIKQPEIGILLITDKISHLCQEEVMHYKLTQPHPLLVEIPAKGSQTHTGKSMEDFISSAVGIRI